jgi:Raf kinase inhibitor-like YbhB/YbcL family protein
MNKYYSKVVVLLLSCLALQVNAQDAPETVTITSSAFDHHGMVPEVNSAYSDNVSIDLSWSDLPAGTQQLALICDDPEVVEIGMMEQPFVHWVMYNIPASASGLPAGLPSDTELSIDGLEGAINGLNGLRRPGYFGPHPPANGHLHAYHFRIYALDDELDLDSGLGKDELLAEMEGHVLATGMLMGHYERKE